MSRKRYAAYNELYSLDEDYDEPVWFNPKTGEFVAFRLQGDMLLCPQHDKRGS